MTQHIGILTSGGDSPGLNAAIRGVGKAASGFYDMRVIGIRDGFRGLVENRIMQLDGAVLSGILTRGGTILGTSREKPHRMHFNGKRQDMTDVIMENYQAHHLDALVCIGGGGTQKNALQLMEKGLNVITLPKTIDNDVAHTDTTFGFDTALGIATDAIDRLHSTAHSHHRIIVVEIMGHRAGWLALGSGVAGGADVILLPEIPYDIENVAEAIRRRAVGGMPFSIVAVAEGALPKGEAERVYALREEKLKASDKRVRKQVKAELAALEADHANHTVALSRQLEALTGLESRVTILGYLQRGGTPSAADRLLATRLGTACADLIADGVFGVMVAARGELAVPVPLVDVAGFKKLVPTDHPWVVSAKRVGTSFGDA
ncbi:MAG: 6-phosphofructokinase [Candidatus Thiodiazotropha sp. (ex Dulcina madagascariensis)]|nr:6-phosphofructokinase [Candidatus Thiodiazotropha sp. (ex Dulcina madagascariensis)]MCU7925634.1 6-phosphofructokinase [Candidatus Thiodiazotropha sp. (ex Dulcina madagascariensis)]